MPKPNAGLSFAEAVQEAMAEEEAATSSQGADANDPTIDSDSPEDEQSAIEEVEEDDGLFDSLFDNEDGPEQPNADSDTIDIDGEHLTIDELRAGYMRQADYTRKTQELAAQREEAEDALALWHALNDNPSETLQHLNRKLGTYSQYPAYSQAQYGQPAQQQAQGQPNPNDIANVVESKVRELLENDPRLKLIETESYMRQLDQVFKEIESNHNLTLSNSDKEVILKTADRVGTTDLEFVFNGLMQQKAQKDAQRQNAAAASTASGRRTDPADAVEAPPQKYESFKDVVAEVMRDENLDDLFKR